MGGFQSPACGKKIEPGKFMKSMLQNVISGSLDVVCGGISSLDECNTKYSNSVNTLRSIRTQNMDINQASFFGSVLNSINKITAVDTK